MSANKKIPALAALLILVFTALPACAYKQQTPDPTVPAGDQTLVRVPMAYAMDQTPDKAPKAYAEDKAPAASAGNDQPGTAADEEPAAKPTPDPLMGWNRFWFGFNDAFLTYFGKPFVTVYTFVVPNYLRERVHNAYRNYLFPMRFLNALLQLRPDKASRELGRFIINTTFGLGGLYDLAGTNPNMRAQTLDFGQTLGVWGAGQGFYLVLPLLGPSSLRDGIGLVGDTAADPMTYVSTPILLSLGMSVGNNLNDLPHTLSIYEELKRSSVEPYVSARDAYLQLRQEDVRQALAK